MIAETVQHGYFTLPGEAGYEDLTLELAQKWGADAIRDSDGTVLSDKIVSAGFDIYSTLCMVRIDNAWAKANMDKLQQNYLMSYPVTAVGSSVTINLLDGYFREQYNVNVNDDPTAWWQVFDRTTGEEVLADRWQVNAEAGTVTITDTRPWHNYTVNFLAYRIWEAISMYNHITNDWGDREHLMPIDPIYPETQAFMLQFLDRWLTEHPRTKVVRFTSMFYNFAWFWGDLNPLRYTYAEWGAYETTVSPRALEEFAKTKGYRMTSEDFVNNGAYCCSHNVPSKRYQDWIDFMNEFVVTFGRTCIDVVHQAGKEAYMFYDDHWVGTEPYSDRFKDFTFDGIIKCVFNAFEARLCAGVKHVNTRELRLHPYLFPTGLKGEPTFKEGGDPTRDCKNFWINIRRGLLRAPVDRIGLGGYLHLVENYPDFVEYIETLTQEFRTLREVHQQGSPYVAPFKVAILTAWGKLRSWICNGHFIHRLALNELLESLAGLPIDVEFLSFEDILNMGVPADVRVIINCGKADSAWCGGEHWKNAAILETITGWVANGGGLIGIEEPSACEHTNRYFQLADVLGVDREIGRTLSKDKIAYTTDSRHFILKDLEGAVDLGKSAENIFLVDPKTCILAEQDGSPQIATHTFHAGRSLYFAGYNHTPQNTRLLHRALYWAAGVEADFGPWTCNSIQAECAYFAESQTLIVINNTKSPVETEVFTPQQQSHMVSLAPYGMHILTL